MSSSWRRSWAASLVAAFLGLACTRGSGEAPPAPTAPDPEVEACRAGWMGAYARRDPEIEALLTGGGGWAALRDTRLYDAIQTFSAEDQPGLGLVRTYGAFAEFYAALDELFLDTEALYLESSPSEPHTRRRAWVALLRGDLDVAARLLGSGEPAGYPGVLARAGLAFLRGDRARLRELSRSGPAPADEEEKVLGLVACYLWGVPCPTGDRTPYGQAVDAFRQGDLASGVLALEMIDFNQVADAPGADLFLYALLRRGFGGLAGSAAARLGADYWTGLGYELQGERRKALEFYGRAPKAAPAGPGMWLFGPIHGNGEAGRLARIREGALLHAEGRPAEALARWREAVSQRPGPLELAMLAAAQTAAGAAEPLGEPVESARAAARKARELPGRLGDDPAAGAIEELYGVRRAEVARWAARVFWARGLDREALEVLDAAHQKAQGRRPDFRNPPAFLADLARGYARVGQFAPAVAVLFDLAQEYPSARLAYESLKRLYASRTGGEVPPR